MNSAHEFLSALAAVLCVAAVTTLLFHRLRQPVVLGYILAGIIIGPHVQIPLVANPTVVQTLSELGVILLMFGLGLELRVATLLRAAPTAGVTALVQCSFMLWIGYVTGRVLGWTAMESVFIGAAIAISSTTIIAKAFDEQHIRGRLRELVVAILIGEDLIAVMLIALLTGFATGSGLSATELALTIGKLLAFLGGLVIVGMLIVPRVMRVIVRQGRDETTIIASIGLCFGLSLLAHSLGYSVALGAFVAGMLIAESGEAHRIEPLVHPVRDVFAAVFFVSVGMMIDPSVIVEQWVAVLVFTVVVIGGKIVSVTLGAILTGNGTRTSIAAGMSLAQIGEFSFIIAGLGASLGAVGSQLYPVAVSVSALTTLTTPWLIRASDRTARWVDRSLPQPLQTLASLYEGWIERMGTTRKQHRSNVRRFVRQLALDAIVVAGVVIAVSVAFGDLVALFRGYIYDDRTVARIAIVAASGAIALPFCVGILRSTHRLAAELANAIVPRTSEVDLAKAPRAVIIATVHLGGVLIAGLPLVALTQPFLPGYTAAIVLLIALAVLGVVFWRTVRDFHGHVRAATHVLVEALAAQSGAQHPAEPGAVDAMGTANELLPGIGAVRIVVPPGSSAIGQSLATLALRGRTGATVLAIFRGDQELEVPDAHAPLCAGDVLAVAGAHDAIEAATRILTEGAEAGAGAEGAAGAEGPPPA